MILFFYFLFLLKKEGKKTPGWKLHSVYPPITGDPPIETSPNKVIVIRKAYLSGPLEPPVADVGQQAD